MSNGMEVSWCSNHHNVETLEIQGPCWERGKPCTLCALEAKAKVPPSSKQQLRTFAIGRVIEKIDAWQNAEGRMVDHTFDLLGDARRELQWVLDDAQRSAGETPAPPLTAICGADTLTDAPDPRETSASIADSGIPEVEWLAMLARDDKYASVEHCDVPIQDRRSLIAAVKRLTSRVAVKTSTDAPL